MPTSRPGRARHLLNGLLTVALATTSSLLFSVAPAQAEAGDPGTSPAIRTADGGRLQRPGASSVMRPDSSLPRAKSRSAAVPAAAATASISGRVTDSKGTGIDGAIAAVYPKGSDEAFTAVYTDTSGAYTLAGMAAGNYILCFFGPQDSDYAAECWDNEPVLETADAIKVATGKAITGKNAQLSVAGSVSGNVSDLGTPLEGSEVCAAIYRSRWYWYDCTETDSSGNFEMTGLFPGTYSMAFEDPYALVTVTGTNVGLAWVDAKDKIRATVKPTISGVPEVGAKLTAKPGTGIWSGTPVSYRWLRDGTDTGATGSSYPLTAADLGAAVSVVATSTLTGDGSSISVASAPTAGIALTDQPKIAEPARVGSTLSVNPGVWTEGTHFVYQWYADGKAINGATAGTYKIPSSVVGKRLSAKVTGSLAGHATLSKTTAQTAKVMLWAQPKVSGQRAVGQKLTAARGTWTSKTAFSYQWLRNGEKIDKATKTSYKLTAADLGTEVTFQLTGKRSGYTTVVTESAPTGFVTTASTPTITGTAGVGKSLTAVAGNWTDGTVFEYQWFVDGRSVGAASAVTDHVIGAAQAGKRISVRVTGTLAGYATVTLASSSTAKVLAWSTPTITGTAAVGSKLTAKAGTWTSKTKLSYQWLRGGVAIEKATKSTYTLTGLDTGQEITVRLTGKRSGYATVVATSAGIAVPA